jgi:hypothetical protein
MAGLLLQVASKRRWARSKSVGGYLLTLIVCGQSAVAMRIGARLSGAKFTFFSRSRSACRAADGQNPFQIDLDLHGVRGPRSARCSIRGQVCIRDRSLSNIANLASVRRLLCSRKGIQWLNLLTSRTEFPLDGLDC